MKVWGRVCCTEGMAEVGMSLQRWERPVGLECMVSKEESSEEGYMEGHEGPRRKARVVVAALKDPSVQRRTRPSISRT